MPSEPAKAAARSDRMSACRLVATTVSMVCGRITMRMVMASTSILSKLTSGNSAAISAAISSHITMAAALRIGLAHHREELARPRSGEPEGETHDALDAGSGEHGDVGGGFERRTL